MPRVSYRLARVSELLQREVAVLLHNEIADPRVKSVTLTAVKMAPDLSYARIYFTLLEASEAKAVAHALNHTVSYLRRRLAALVQLRIVPQLHFIYDQAMQDAQRLTQLIDAVAIADEKPEKGHE